MENFNQDHLSNLDLEIDRDVRLQLNDAAKWAKFISIVMFVACGLILIFGVIGGSFLSTAFEKLGTGYPFLQEISSVLLIGIVVFVAAVLAFVYYFLFNFSKKIKVALLSESTVEFNAGLKSLKIFFIITTVFAMLSLLSNIYSLFF
jgi:hypothetical protein